MSSNNPLPEFASFVALADKAADNAFEVIAQLRAHISDLTRRLAEAEADLADTREDSTVLAAVTKEWMDANAILGNPADGPLCEMERQRDTERRRAEAAERELEELKRSTK